MVKEKKQLKQPNKMSSLSSGEHANIFKQKMEFSTIRFASKRYLNVGKSLQRLRQILLLDMPQFPLFKGTSSEQVAFKVFLLIW